MLRAVLFTNHWSMKLLWQPVRQLNNQYCGELINSGLMLLAKMKLAFRRSDERADRWHVYGRGTGMAASVYVLRTTPMPHCAVSRASSNWLVLALTMRTVSPQRCRCWCLLALPNIIVWQQCLTVKRRRCAGLPAAMRYITSGRCGCGLTWDQQQQHQCSHSANTHLENYDSLS